MDRLKIMLAAAGAALTLGAAPALAHHSAAMFDAGKTQTLVGEVTAIEWTNPHAWLSIRTAAPEPGKPAIWHLEMVGPAALGRLGFTREMFSPGARLTVQHHPLRDGRSGGQLISVTFADGRTLRAVGSPAAAVK